MNCRLCQTNGKLCRSHIVPEFLYSTLYDSQHRYIEVHDVTKGRVRRGQKGYYERLLCEDCEASINRLEKHARRMFVDPLPPFTDGSARIREHARLDPSRLALFFLSILWRASISQISMFRHVALGPHEEKIRNVLLSDDSRAAFKYPIAIFALNYDGGHLRDFFVEPTHMRVEGRRCYRFVLMGFVVLIFVASIPAPDPYPRIVVDPTKPVRSFDADLREFRFLREVWELAARTTKDVQV